MYKLAHTEGAEGYIKGVKGVEKQEKGVNTEKGVDIKSTHEEKGQTPVEPRQFLLLNKKRYKDSVL